MGRWRHKCPYSWFPCNFLIRSRGRSERDLIISASYSTRLIGLALIAKSLNFIWDTKLKTDKSGDSPKLKCKRLENIHHGGVPKFGILECAEEWYPHWGPSAFHYTKKFKERELSYTNVRLIHPTSKPLNSLHLIWFDIIISYENHELVYVRSFETNQPRSYEESVVCGGWMRCTLIYNYSCSPNLQVVLVWFEWAKTKSLESNN